MAARQLRAVAIGEPRPIIPSNAQEIVPLRWRKWSGGV